MSKPQQVWIAGLPEGAVQLDLGCPCPCGEGIVTAIARGGTWSKRPAHADDGFFFCRQDGAPARQHKLPAVTFRVVVEHNRSK